MTTFTIDAENSITAFPTPDHAEAAVGTGAQPFTSQQHLAELAAAWPAERLLAIWNSFAGVAGFGADLKPVQKFTDRKTAIKRIWTAIQKLATVPQTSEAAAETAAPKASTAKPAAEPEKPKAQRKATGGALRGPESTDLRRQENGAEHCLANGDVLCRGATDARNRRPHEARLGHFCQAPKGFTQVKGGTIWDEMGRYRKTPIRNPHLNQKFGRNRLDLPFQPSRVPLMPRFLWRTRGEWRYLAREKCPNPELNQRVRRRSEQIPESDRR
jgi:hypothetical protein